MTKKEIIELVSMHNRLYGIANTQEEDIKLLVDVWYYHFKDYPCELVKRCYLEAMKYTPNEIKVYHIFAQLEKIAEKNVPKAVDDWELILRAVEERRKIFDRAQKEYIGKSAAEQDKIHAKAMGDVIDLFNNLPISVKNYLGTYKKLYEIQKAIDNGYSEPIKTLKSEFFDYYKSNYKAHKETALNSLKIGSENALCITQEK